jgi:hypothetical protein
MINRAFAFQPGLLRAAIGLAGLILVIGGCGGPDPGSSDSAASSTSSPTESSATADEDNGNGNGGGIVWPSLPDGPEIPQIMEVYVYSVLEEADSSRCAALFLAEGVEVELKGSSFVVTLDGPSDLSFETGDRTRLLYEAGARLCAGDETAAREAFAEAVSFGPWSNAVQDADTHFVVCTMWDTVAGLLDPSAGACTLQLGDADDGDADATDDATPSADPSATADESDAAADDGVSESDAADATDAP